MESHVSPKMYVIGYILSVVLTIIPLVLTLNHVMGVGALIFTLLLIAALQIYVQLYFFMHVNEGEGPKYHVMALVLGLIVTVTIVGGSMWIMSFNSMVH